MVFASLKTQKCKLPSKKRGVYWHCRQGRATTPDPDGETDKGVMPVSSGHS